jgi:hypothetical protein
MSGEVTTQFKTTTLTDAVLQSPVDRFELRLRRTIIAVSVAVIVVLWLGMAFIF